MKIALVYDALFPYVKGGGERRYHEIARHLRGRHDVHFVSWQYWPGRATVVDDGITCHGVGAPPRFYGSDGRRRTSEALLFALKALPVLARQRFDVIDCASVPFLPLFSVAAASRIRSAAFVATWFEFWGDYWHAYLGSSAPLAKFVEARAARLGDAHIAISRTTAERMQSARRRGTPVRVIEPGVDRDAIRAAGDVGQSFDIVFAGRLNAQKNVALLLHALHDLAASGRQLTCALIGDGPERPRLTRLAHDLGLADSVRFFGRIEDDGDYYRTLKSGRLFVWPSVAEGFGIAPLEAMACGVPPIIAASQFSATADLVADGKSGIIVPADPGSFAEAIRRALSDPPLLASMSKHALARAERSSWSSVANQVEAVYRQAIDLKRR